MGLVYVPKYNSNIHRCVYVLNNNTIRVYRQVPYNPSGTQNTVNIDYIDFHYNSNYYETYGRTSFRYNTALPTCLTSNQITDNWYYRNDLSDILLSFSIIVVFGFGIPIIVFKRLFKKGRYL